MRFSGILDPEEEADADDRSSFIHLSSGTKVASVAVSSYSPIEVLAPTTVACVSRTTAGPSASSGRNPWLSSQPADKRDKKRKKTGEQEREAKESAKLSLEPNIVSSAERDEPRG